VLSDDLQLHHNYLQARQLYATGRISNALALLGEIVDKEGHPDQVAAQALIAEIETGDDAGAET
jgi:hypothetical protein